MTTRIKIVHEGGSHEIRVETPTGATKHLRPGDEAIVDIWDQQQIVVREGALVPATPVEAQQSTPREPDEAQNGQQPENIDDVAHGVGGARLEAEQHAAIEAGVALSDEAAVRQTSA